MADAGQQIVDTGINTGAGMAARAILGRSIPLPDFYNPNSPNHFGDSQFGQMLHGNGAAWGRYGRRALASGIDTGAMATPLGVPNMAWRGVSGLWNMITPDKMHIPQQYTSIGNFISTRGEGNPIGIVGGDPATIENGLATSGDVSIDPWTGQQISGLANYMPNFTGGGNYSSYGPYAGGYQGLPPDGSQPQGPTMPNFDLGDQYAGTRDGNGNPTWDPSADQNGDGRLTPGERRDASDWQLHGPSAFGSGVTNFMVGGAPVITGYRPAGGDMNQMATYNGRDWGG